MVLQLPGDKDDDPQIERIKSDLSEIQQDCPHILHIINIDRDQVLMEEFGDKLPVLDIGVYRLIRSFDQSDIRFAFEKAAARLEEAKNKHNDVLIRRITEPLQMTKSDRFSRWFSNHYMVLLNLFTFLYVFLAVLAPTFMRVGWQTPAKIIYKVYRPLCHQLAFRTFFGLRNFIFNRSLFFQLDRSIK